MGVEYKVAYLGVDLFFIARPTPTPVAIPRTSRKQATAMRIKNEFRFMPQIRGPWCCDAPVSGGSEFGYALEGTEVPVLLPVYPSLKGDFGGGGGGIVVITAGFCGQ